MTEVNKLEGEASINNRKGKLIFFYEWTIKLNWTGKGQPGCQAREALSSPLLRLLEGEDSVALEGRCVGCYIFGPVLR